MWGLLLLAAIPLVVFGYWAVIDVKPLILEGSDTAIILDIAGNPQEKFRPGETMYVRRNICQRRGSMVTLNRYFKDTLLYQLPTLTSWQPAGCFSNMFVADIPSLPPRQYEFVTEVTFHLNPLTDVTMKLQSVSVQILSLK